MERETGGIRETCAWPRVAPPGFAGGQREVRRGAVRVGKLHGGRFHHHAGTLRGDHHPGSDRRVPAGAEIGEQLQRQGYTEPSCSGGPTGSYCVDLPQTVTVKGTALAVSGILFPPSAKAGNYTITFTGVSGTLTSTATANFTVKLRKSERGSPGGRGPAEFCFLEKPDARDR
jgi:hypothetical protein